MDTINIDKILKLAQSFELEALGAKNKKQYVYHIRPSKFKGKYIYPLSELEDVYPEIYKNEIKKYKGRESHPETKIGLLDCKWKDCVNFSTLNPIKLFQLEELLGIPGYKNGINTQVFKFNIKDFQDMNFCLYDDNKNPKRSEAYKKVSIVSYKETEFIPSETVKYFAECKEKKEYPLIFGNVTHLLVKGKIDIGKAELIKFKVNSTIKL